MKLGYHLLLVFAVPLSGCGPPPRGVAFYDTSGGLPDREFVAQLSGPIIAIDGKAVTGAGQRFEVLPGCHVVRMSGTVGYYSSRQMGGAQIHMGETEFAFHAQSDREYYIELKHSGIDSASTVGQVRVQWIVTEFGGEKKRGAPMPLFVGCN